MNDKEILETLKKHISFGHGLFSINITESDPDFKIVKELIKKDDEKPHKPTIQELEDFFNDK